MGRRLRHRRPFGCGLTTSQPRPRSAAASLHPRLPPRLSWLASSSMTDTDAAGSPRYAPLHRQSPKLCLQAGVFSAIRSPLVSETRGSAPDPSRGRQAPLHGAEDPCRSVTSYVRIRKRSCIAIVWVSRRLTIAIAGTQSLQHLPLTSSALNGCPIFPIGEEIDAAGPAITQRSFSWVAIAKSSASGHSGGGCDLRATDNLE